MAVSIAGEKSHMIVRSYVAVALLAGAVIAPGCGNPPGFYPVSGKLVYKGEPAAGAAVYFHRADGQGKPGVPIPGGISGDDGTFTLSCDGVGDGCPPGRYLVLVEWRGVPESSPAPPKAAATTAKAKGKAKQAAPNRRLAREGVDRLKGRYFDAAKPLLHAEVLPQATNRLEPFDLTD
jgi:hypothetical protein